MLSSG
jgi:hypothetical protein